MTKKNEEKIVEFFQKIVGLEVSSIELGLGSFTYINFGNDLVITPDTDDKSTRGEWQIWTYMCRWKLYRDEETVCSSIDEDREELTDSLSILKGKCLVEAMVLSETFDMVLEFDDDLYFYLISDDGEKESEQWNLFTPERKVLVAGPGEELSYENE